MGANEVKIELSDDVYNDSFSVSQPPQGKKKHTLRNSIIIITVILLLLAAAAATLIILAYQTPNSDKFGAEPDSTALLNVVTAAIKDEPAEISNEELNSLIAFFIDGDNKSGGNKSGDKSSSIKEAAIYVHDSKPCELFTMVDIGGHTYEVSAEFKIDSEIKDGEIKFSVTSAKLGSLPLPPGAVLDYAFNGGAADSLNFIRRDGADLYLSAEYDFEVLTQKLNFDIESIEPHEDGITIKTTSILESSVNTLAMWLASLMK